ncbi:MAG: bifunctional glutamate N-acetyltransferase/amino-acid acetyltransferase ArgJ [Sedimentisphaerales bacterium]|nr:bifunctional glutamate N-acetyltransferase/amino-acid acetyltransferase ArgJ [Sedimentisphaerales bacterium]
MATNETITAPRGFLAVGVKCGLKKSGNHDLGLVVCPSGATASAVFTTNKIISAAVQISKTHVKSRTIYAVVVNSGNANACTGQKGIAHAIQMCAETARHIVVDPHEVLVASTGIIGEQMPIKNVIAGIADAAGQLSDSESAGMNFTKAIMTTDTRPKTACRRIMLSDKQVTIAGTTKGAGMIGPDMATTLCFITTDVAITKPLLTKALQNAIGESLNKLTVDGLQSTNDTVFILASGLAGNRLLDSQSSDYKKFTDTLVDLCRDLARQMALDAEGATRMFKVIVKGAASQADAAKAARAVANYDLVKCAVNGGDPNWGRIICAVGSSGVKLNLPKMSCKLDELAVFKNGAPTNFDRHKAGKIVSQTSHTITVDLGVGKYCDFCFGCDLSKNYVTINAEYHT